MRPEKHIERYLIGEKSKLNFRRLLREPHALYSRAECHSSAQLSFNRRFYAWPIATSMPRILYPPLHTPVSILMAGRGRRLILLLPRRI